MLLTLDVFFLGKISKNSLMVSAYSFADVRVLLDNDQLLKEGASR